MDSKNIKTVSDLESEIDVLVDYALAHLSYDQIAGALERAADTIRSEDNG